MLESKPHGEPIVQSPEVVPPPEPVAGDATPTELPLWRKYVVLFIVSWMTLVITFSSTSLLVATPEIADDLSTTPETLNVTNAGVLIAMSLAVLIWPPLSDVFGRRKIYNIAIFFMTACTVGAALAPNLAVFTTMRVLSGLTGCYFMVAGQTLIADIFEPVRLCSAFNSFYSLSLT
jgi:MFS family permease